MTQTRRLIRNKHSGKFLAGDYWTEDISQALVFNSPAEAVGACKKYRLQDVELVLDFGDPRLNVAVPICD